MKDQKIAGSGQGDKINSGDFNATGKFIVTMSGVSKVKQMEFGKDDELLRRLFENYAIYAMEGVLFCIFLSPFDGGFHFVQE